MSNKIRWTGRDFLASCNQPLWVMCMVSIPALVRLYSCREAGSRPRLTRKGAQTSVDQARRLSHACGKQNRDMHSLAPGAIFNLMAAGCSVRDQDISRRRFAHHGEQVQLRHSEGDIDCFRLIAKGACHAAATG